MRPYLDLDRSRDSPGPVRFQNRQDPVQVLGFEPRFYTWALGTDPAGSSNTAN